MKLPIGILAVTCLTWNACQSTQPAEEVRNTSPLTPAVITEATLVDTDDPAIWIHPEDAANSLILGTDKGDYNGGIYVFDLDGRIIREKCLPDLPRPNNIDVEYGLALGGDTVDIAVFTQRNGGNIRVIRLPEMRYIDGGGIPVFAGDSIRDPMGVGLYKHPVTGIIYAMVSRKSGPDGTYLWQYALADSLGTVVAKPVRTFGAFKGGKEIEAIAVDDAAGFVYYSDEGSGVRKYYADPDSSNRELAILGTTGFAEDHEGISIYPTGGQSGYILVSDQQANRFHVFDRQSPHTLLAILPLSTTDSDGSEVTAVPCGDRFPNGFLVAMADDQTFQVYPWHELEAAIRAQAGQHP